MAKDGEFTCEPSSLEVMGRDTSIVSMHTACEAPAIRSIVIAGEEEVKLLEEIFDGVRPAPDSKGKLKFHLRPGKVHLFDVSTGDRIWFS